MAPDLDVKRRKKHEQTENYQEQYFKLQKIELHQKVQTANLNCQTSTEGECVWLYNQSQIPVFVTSPTLEAIPSEQLQNIPKESETNSMLSQKAHDQSKLDLMDLGN